MPTKILIFILATFHNYSSFQLEDGLPKLIKFDDCSHKMQVDSFKNSGILKIKNKDGSIILQLDSPEQISFKRFVGDSIVILGKYKLAQVINDTISTKIDAVSLVTTYTVSEYSSFKKNGKWIVYKRNNIVFTKDYCSELVIEKKIKDTLSINFYNKLIEECDW